MKPISVPIISFFSGGGFLDLGFEKAGFQIIWKNEFNYEFADMSEYAMTALRKAKSKNIISSRANVLNLSADQIKCDAFGDLPPDLYGIIGGPPCPDFASGGKHRGHEGDHGMLSKTYIDIVCALRPSFFVMENVPGLVHFRKHREFFNKLRHQAHASGFLTDFTILNALKFGAPQDRRRVFLIGVSRHLWDVVKKGISKPENDGWFPFPEAKYPYAEKYPWPRVSEIGVKPELPEGIPLELMSINSLQEAGIGSGLPNCDEYFIPYSSKFLTVREGDDTRKSFKRLHRYRYSPTVCYGNNEVHLHPWEPRRLSVREALRLQTVPDNYILPGGHTLSAKFKMIANGVPVVLASALAKSLMKFIAPVNCAH